MRRIRMKICFTIFIFDFISATPIRTEDYMELFRNETTGSDMASEKVTCGARGERCRLPGKLGHMGHFRFIEDCETLEMFETVPVASCHGPVNSIPEVCCPDKLEGLCFPSDPWCPTFDEENYAGDAVFGRAFKCPEEVQLVSQLGNRCKNSSCVPISRCKDIDGEKQVNDLFCGVDNYEVKVCCDEEEILFDSLPPQPPRFPDIYGEIYGETRPCEDKTPMYSVWAKQGACRLDTNFETGTLKSDPSVCNLDMFNFMSLACQESCGWCANKGCVDEHPKCSEWARNKLCDTRPFLGIPCRESCGVCGFLSPENTEEQIDPSGYSYSYIQQENFLCGSEFAPDRQQLNDGYVNPRVVESESSPEFDPLTDTNDDENVLEDPEIPDGFVQDEEQNIACGSVMISDRWLLTAAHCSEDFNSTTSDKFNEFRKTGDLKEYIKSRKVFVHPYYEDPKLYNDIALIQLGRRLVFNFIEFQDTPTCVGRNIELDGKIALVERIETSGDGKLRTANVTLIESQKCKSTLEEFVSQSNQISSRNRFCDVLDQGILDQHVCGIASTSSFEQDSSASEGDSGRPVTITDNGKQTLVGIVSGSLSCGSEKPEWYTKVAYYRNWIDCIIKTANGNKLSRDEVQAECLQFAENYPSPKLDICTK